MKKILDVINKLTPAQDKLAHFFWGDIYSTIGLLCALIGSVFTGSILLAFLPFIFSAIPAYMKEQRDSKGYGAIELKDFIYTVASSIPKTISLLIFIV